MPPRRRSKTADEAIAEETRVFMRNIELLQNEEFLKSNTEALAALKAGKRGISLEEFRKKYPYPQP